MGYKAIADAIGLVLEIETRYSRTESLNEDVRKASATDPNPTGTSLKRRGRQAAQYLLILIASVLVVDALVGDRGLLAMIAKRQEHRVLEQSLTRARTENARLREEARRLREDPDAIEDIARRQLGMIKPGEKLFIIKDVDPAAR